MTVSVIVPTYNRNDLLFGRCLPSLLKQTYGDIEVIVVADGMEGDALVELNYRLVGLQAETEITLRLRNIQRPLYGLYGVAMQWGLSGIWARNWGLDEASTDFVALLDDDDEMHPEALDILMGEMTPDLDFVYGKADTYKNGRRIGQTYGHWPPGDGSVTHGSFVMRHDLGYRYEVAAFDRGHNPDADMWMRMYAGGVRFKFIPTVVSKYHRNWP